jgi:hypothetical protein
VFELPPFPNTHNMGTCRQSEKPRDGVCNKYGQTHDIPNLFISDGSQFTSGGAENPTLTIVALAIRQAEYNHYRISLVAGQTDNPDQRIAEDVYRFINGGSDGYTTAYGIYDFSILLISTISSLVSFAVVLWDRRNRSRCPAPILSCQAFCSGSPCCMQAWGH